jgi:hypothetical protein
MDTARLLLGLTVAVALPASVAGLQMWWRRTVFTAVYAAYAIYHSLHGGTAVVVWLVAVVVSSLGDIHSIRKLLWARSTSERVAVLRDLRRRFWLSVARTRRVLLRRTRRRRATGPAPGAVPVVAARLDTAGAAWPAYGMLLSVVLLVAGAAKYGDRIPGVVATFVNDTRMAVIISGLLLAVFVGNTVVLIVLMPYIKLLRSDGSVHKIVDFGLYLGWVERAIVFIFVAAGHPDAAALAIATKSFVRLPEVQRHTEVNFGQYVAMGTLLSLLIAVSFGILVRLALGLNPI